MGHLPKISERALCFIERQILVAKRWILKNEIRIVLLRTGTNANNAVDTYAPHFAHYSDGILSGLNMEREYEILIQTWPYLPDDYKKEFQAKWDELNTITAGRPMGPPVRLGGTRT